MSVLHISTQDEFSKEVLASTRPVLVDFWATWCGPCRMLAPIIEEIGEQETSAVIVKVDIDKAESIAAQYRIQSIPTLVFIKAGQEVQRIVGLRPKAELVAALAAIK